MSVMLVNLQQHIFFTPFWRAPGLDMARIHSWKENTANCLDYHIDYFHTGAASTLT